MLDAIVWTTVAESDMLFVPAFHRPRILEAVELLRHQALIETRNRKPLSEPLEGLPSGSWQIRVGAYRVFYWVEEEERTVHVLRAIFKGTSPTADALARGKRP